MHQREFISPRQLAAAIGVSESSLKRWSDKGLLHVNKTAGGHRRIPLATVFQFLRTTQTPLANPEILGLRVTADRGPLTAVAAAAATHCSLLAGDTPGATAVAVRFYLSNQSMAAVCDRLLQPAMAAIGEDWAAGRIDVFEEHRATQTCFSVLAELRRFTPDPPRDAPLAVGAAAAGDPYMLATAMVQLCFIELGWRAVNLGPDLPLESLERAAEASNARAAWLSVSANAAAEMLSAHVGSLRERLGGKQRMLILGGRGLEKGAALGNLSTEGVSDLPRLLASTTATRRASEEDFVGL